MNDEELYDSIAKNDNPETESGGWIQWKETDACIDLYCLCGHSGHLDGEFLYFVECPPCGTKYAVGQNIKLIPLDDEQIRSINREFESF